MPVCLGGELSPQTFVQGQKRAGGNKKIRQWKTGKDKDAENSLSSFFSLGMLLVDLLEIKK